MTGRPPKFIPDHLTPMPSHLLATLLSDLTQEPPTSSPEVQRPAPPLPQGHHLVYFPTQTPPSRLAADGADRDHEPPRGRTPRRRLWAGGEVVFREGWRRALRLDARPWACREAVEGVRRAGDRVFVHVWRRYGAGHAGGREGWDIEERRTLAFVPSPVGEPAAAASASESSQPRRPPRTRTPFTPPPPPPRPYSHAPQSAHKDVWEPADAHPPSLAVPVRPPTPAHLFHFSALTLNAHAIHIDPRYAAAADGHRALLVHGPLALALMLRVLARCCGGARHPEGVVRRLTYRNYAPLYVGEPLTVCVGRLAAPSTWDVWVEGPGGALAVRGTAEVEAEAE